MLALLLHLSSSHIQDGKKERESLDRRMGQHDDEGRDVSKQASRRPRPHRCGPTAQTTMGAGAI